MSVKSFMMVSPKGEVNSVKISSPLAEYAHLNPSNA